MTAAGAAVTPAGRWTYLGEMPGSDTKVVAVWRTGDGERIAWKSTANTRGVVGYQYDVAEFDGTKWPAPKWTGEQAEDVAELQLIARAAADRKRIEQAIARAKRNPAHQALMDRVAEFAAGMTWEAKEQLAKELARAVYR